MARRDAFFSAIEANDVAEVRRLLVAEPRLARARNPQGISAVLAARYRQHDALLQAVLEAGPELDVFDAAATGNLDRLGELLDAEPELAGTWSADGFTPLHLAAFFGQPAAVRMLLDHRSPVDAVGRNAMEVQPLNAAVAGHNHAAVEMLIAAGADINARMHGGWTPLMAAAASGDGVLVDLLLADGADPAVEDDTGKDAAELADEHGQHGIASRLRRKVQEKQNRSSTW